MYDYLETPAVAIELDTVERNIRPLVESRMGCIATDRITVDGLRVARAIIGRYAPAEG